MRSSPLATAMSGLMVLALIATLVLVLLLPMLATLVLVLRHWPLPVTSFSAATPAFDAGIDPGEDRCAKGMFS